MTTTNWVGLAPSSAPFAFDESLVPSSDKGAEQRTEDIRRDLQRLGRHDWSLWGLAVVVILSLTTAVTSLSLSIVSEPNEPFYQFHISQSVRGLVGLVLMFSIYTLFQQVQLRRTRARLSEQIEIATMQQVRAETFLKMAMLDPLTGLHNRRYAQERLSAEIARVQRYGGSLTVLMLDLDDLKRLNDNHGHSAGDLSLKKFAERLSAAIRGSDLAVRIGGDEFLVLLPECKVGQIQLVLARLAQLEIEINGNKIPFTFSAGWTVYREGENADQLVQRADHALYAEKQSRKNQAAPRPAEPEIEAAGVGSRPSAG
jgi:diguanylate cyclase (GGDEF)-like protein